MLTKEDYEKAVKILEEEPISLADIANKVGALAVIDNLIEEHFDPQPYKWEDLRKGMWIYDSKPEYEEWSFLKITKILSEKDCEYLYHDKNKKVFFDNMECHAREFEENRFFPITKALQYQGKEDEDV